MDFGGILSMDIGGRELILGLLGAFNEILVGGTGFVVKGLKIESVATEVKAFIM